MEDKRGWWTLRNGQSARITALGANLLLYGIVDGVKNPFKVWWGNGNYQGSDEHSLDLISRTEDPKVQIINAHIPQYSC